jgi:ORF6N domain
MNDKMSKDRSLIPVERIERSILLIRGHKVMLDRDLASLYGVTTKVLTRRSKDIKTGSLKISCSN